MFDFTREVVLNDISGVSQITLANGNKALSIKRVNDYDTDGFSDVWKSPGYAAVKEVATITLPAAQTAGVYRLELDVTTSGSYSINYDRWAINKGKPFYVEFLVGADQATADGLATVALPLIKKGLIKYHGEGIKDVVVTKGTGTIIVTAQNEYLRIKGATITKLDETTTDGEYKSIGATMATTTPGKEGFGSAWYLTKNVRIPTQEATRFLGEGQDETPMVGAIYNQYTFEYSAKRGFTGTNAVGEKLESKTTHVFWIPATLSAAFEVIVKAVLLANSTPGFTPELRNAITKAIIA